MSSSDSGDVRLVVSPDDHRAVIVIVVVACLLWSIMVVSARGIWRIHQKSDFGFDDAVATFGTVLSAAQAGVTLAAVGAGFGKQETLVDENGVQEAGRYLYAGAILYVLCMCASKASMPLLIARLTRERTQALYTRVLLAIILLWGIASTIGIAFECGIPVSWTEEAHSTCGGLFAAWTVIEVLGLLIEVAIVGMAISLVANLQMHIRYKTAVVGSFAFRALLVIPVAFRLDLLRKVTESSDPFFQHVDLTVVTQIILHYSLWAASFPCMRAFLRAFDTGMGVTTRVSTHKGSNYASDERKGSTSYALTSISKEKMNNLRVTTRVPSSPVTPVESDAIGKVMIAGRPPPRPQRPTEGAELGRERTSDETASESSRKAIITRTVEWKINYEDAPGQAI